MSKELRKEIGNDKIYNLVITFKKDKDSYIDKVGGDTTLYYCDDFHFILNQLNLYLNDNTKLNKKDYIGTKNITNVKKRLVRKDIITTEEVECDILTIQEFDLLSFWLKKIGCARANKTLKNYEICECKGMGVKYFNYGEEVFRTEVECLIHILKKRQLERL